MHRSIPSFSAKSVAWKDEVLYFVRCRDGHAFLFLLQLKSRWKWPCRLKITTTLKSWRISHRHNTRQSRKTLPRRYDLFSSFHLSILSLPIPFFFSSAPHFLLSSPILPPSFSFFLCSLFFPPVIPSSLIPLPPFILSLSSLSPSFLSLSSSYPLPPFLLFFSSLPILLPPSFPLPTLYHFSHPLPLFSPSSFPPLSLNSFLPPHSLFVPLILPNVLTTVFLPICHLVNRFNALNAEV